MEKTIYYFINYNKSTTAIGETNPPYMKEKGYILVNKETYDNYISTNSQYLAKRKEMKKLREKIFGGIKNESTK
ncbi:MAG: hypothetical protein J6S85_00950 [Methanobrevibacter sp.]|nr:hypothetical protein [Methanobrevibacter sp.]MBO7712100.1 hypothetical protein [Methanobrevibacter sp.]